MIRIMNTKLVCQIHLNRVRTKKLIFPGVGLIGPAGVGLPGVKLDWLARTAEWAGSHNLSKLNENRAPTLTACEEGVPAPPQSVISRVETFISGMQRHRDGTWDQERRPIPTPRGKKEAAKGGGERSVQPSERCQQGTGRWTDSTSLFFPRTIHLESTIK